MPLQRRMPKRGFLNRFKKHFELVSLKELSAFESGAMVDPEAMKKAGLIRMRADGVKVLSDGEIGKALTVRAHGFSKKAKEKIEAAGGKVEVLSSVRCVKKPVKEG
jgi:large subunit ribosomal protein L15